MRSVNVFLKNRFPIFSEIFTVYSVIVFFWYSWAMLVFLYNLPSLMLSASLDEILSYFAYGMVFVFLDTVLVLAILLGVTGLAPSSLLKDDFIAGGSVLAILFFFWMSVINFALGYLAYWPEWKVFMVLVTILASIILFEYIFRRFSIPRRIILWLSSSAGIFVYPYGFLSAIGVIVVFLRNLF